MCVGPAGGAGDFTRGAAGGGDGPGSASCGVTLGHMYHGAPHRRPPGVALLGRPELCSCLQFSGNYKEPRDRRPFVFQADTALPFLAPASAAKTDVSRPGFPVRAGLLSRPMGGRGEETEPGLGRPLLSRPGPAPPAGAGGLRARRPPSALGQPADRGGAGRDRERPLALRPRGAQPSAELASAAPKAPAPAAGSQGSSLLRGGWGADLAGSQTLQCPTPLVYGPSGTPGSPGHGPEAGGGTPGTRGGGPGRSGGGS